MSKNENLIKAETIITGHVNADFDCLAAIVAAGKLYPEATLVFPGSQEKNLRNFYMESATYFFNFKHLKEIDKSSVKLLVVVDTSRRKRIIHVDPILKNPGLKIHIYDHHMKSECDLDPELIIKKPWGSSVAILSHEIREKGIEINQEEATIMGLGLYEDTGSFTFNSTTEHDFEAGKWLLKNGMELDVITDLLNRDLSAQQITLLGRLLEGATTHTINDLDVVISEISTSEYVVDFSVLVHKFMDVENIKVLFALGRMNDRIHLVARSRTPDIDVGAICTNFGGGGHVYAASATIKDRTLAEVRDELFALLYSKVSPRLNVESIMSKPPVAIPRDMTISKAVERMTQYSLKGVPVVDSMENMRVVGLLEQKTADKALSHNLGDVDVEIYMQHPFSSIKTDSGMHRVMEIILGQKQRLVPVVENDRVEAVVTRTDLINMLVQDPARIPESLFPDKKQERNIRNIMRNRLPNKILDILETAGEMAAEIGTEAYVVGGFVRDVLLTKSNLDLDLVVESDGIAFAKKLAKRMDGRAKYHRKFKTAVVILPDGQRVDVATARLEYYEYPAALPTVELSSIKMDLYRRDFTINALAVHINPSSFGKLVDFFGSQRDLKDKTIRVLHALSFVEDPTRIMRAIRFEQRFDFKIGGQTLNLIKNALKLNLINKLSGYRLTHEMRIILNEANVLRSIERMNELGVLEAIHPLMELNSARSQVIAELERLMSWYSLLYLEPPLSVWKTYFLAMCMGVSKAKMEQIYDRFSFSPSERREFIHLRDAVFWAAGNIMNIKQEMKPSEIYETLSPVPLEGVLFIMARTKREMIKKYVSQYLTSLRLKTIDVTGEDLKDLGLEPGPLYSEFLNQVKLACLDGKLKGRDEQIQFLKDKIKKSEKTKGA
ncbi:CBS domain-containing protein [Maridesulfovibrio salexigens]|uniref:Polynucleotide adenylyltransferase region n=1 Tax=Maridesulfovibrio salexigens (strain ATCC 14822 / DSM 2638 / NCIMB 8403 / VKM B-1763) TaxID=526222 RepID=C6BUK5_MARSD|nr:CBS domain-containing protein [Maridesulfovibrio salexigens]ACS80014.1 Polynucleotide adenylyltransferase region [Maridesulfovibrio salexigens DSM 2638]